MKANIHPKWYPEAKVKCACGNEFTISATFSELEVEVCDACHPFYTGQMKYVDKTGRVEGFIEKRKKAKKKVISKAEKRAAKKAKRVQKELEKPDTLEDLRAKIKKGKKSK